MVSGAGLSFAAPSSLPLAAECKARYVAIIRQGLPTLLRECVTDDVLIDGPTTPPLEQVVAVVEASLDRWRPAAAWHARRPLIEMIGRSALPNEAHRLAAAHLDHGGRHVTLNFDELIELAGAQNATSMNCVGPGAAYLPPGGLLHAHGVLHDPSSLAINIEEVLLGLPAGISGCLHSAISESTRVVVTGYAGRDVDFVPELVEALRSRRASPPVELIWCDPNRRVREEIDRGPVGQAIRSTGTSLLLAPDTAVQAFERFVLPNASLCPRDPPAGAPATALCRSGPLALSTDEAAEALLRLLTARQAANPSDAGVAWLLGWFGNLSVTDEETSRRFRVAVDWLRDREGGHARSAGRRLALSAYRQLASGEAAPLADRAFARARLAMWSRPDRADLDRADGWRRRWMAAQRTVRALVGGLSAAWFARGIDGAAGRECRMYCLSVAGNGFLQNALRSRAPLGGWSARPLHAGAGLVLTQLALHELKPAERRRGHAIYLQAQVLDLELLLLADLGWKSRGKLVARMIQNVAARLDELDRRVLVINHTAIATHVLRAQALAEVLRSGSMGDVGNQLHQDIADGRLLFITGSQHQVDLAAIRVECLDRSERRRRLDDAAPHRTRGA